MPPRVYSAAACPKRSLDNGWKLPPEAHEGLDRLGDHHKHVICFTGKKSPPNHGSKSNIHEVKASDCLLAQPPSSGDCASDDPKLSPPEQWPNPAPPENFGDPNQVFVNAACHSSKPANNLLDIQHVCLQMASTSSAFILSVKNVVLEKKDCQNYPMLATVSLQPRIVLPKAWLQLLVKSVPFCTSSSVQLECYKHSAINWSLMVVLAFCPSCQLFPVLSPLLVSGHLLHLILTQVQCFLYLAISLPLALASKIHLSIILKIIFGPCLLLQILPFKQVHQLSAHWWIIVQNLLQAESMCGTSWWGDFTPSVIAILATSTSWWRGAQDPTHWTPMPLMVSWPFRSILLLLFGYHSSFNYLRYGWTRVFAG